jgi:hypothetical protein
MHPAGSPARHQLAELPPLAVEISEHRLQRVCCPDCGRTVRAELPAGVPRGCFGQKLEAALPSSPSETVSPGGNWSS